MNKLQKIQDFFDEINYDYFLKEQFQAFAFTLNYAMIGLHQFIYCRFRGQWVSTAKTTSATQSHLLVKLVLWVKLGKTDWMGLQDCKGRFVTITLGNLHALDFSRGSRAYLESILDIAGKRRKMMSFGNVQKTSCRCPSKKSTNPYVTSIYDKQRYKKITDNYARQWKQYVERVRKRRLNKLKILI